jgi:CRP-like cAMP-binding protein
MYATLFDNLRQFGRELVAAPDEVIIEANEPPQGAYLVMSGQVCLSLVNGSGAPVWSRTVGQGAILGIASAIGNDPQPFRAVAVDTSEMSFIERKKLAKLVLDNPTIGIEVLTFLSAEVIEAQRKWSMLLSTGKSTAWPARKP